MADMAVNYCPELGTVLSNEEIETDFLLMGGILLKGECFANGCCVLQHSRISS